nr:unnamed protein product [Naegleria fowleri]
MSILDLDDFEDSSVDHSEEGSWRSNKNSEQQLSARSENPSSHHQHEEENPHEIEDLDPMMFGGIETHHNSVEDENESNEEEEQNNNTSKDPPNIVDLEDFELSDDEQTLSNVEHHQLESSAQSKVVETKAIMEEKHRDESYLEDTEDFDEFSEEDQEVTVLHPSSESIKGVVEQPQTEERKKETRYNIQKQDNHIQKDTSERCETQQHDRLIEKEKTQCMMNVLPKQELSKVENSDQEKKELRQSKTSPKHPPTEVEPSCKIFKDKPESLFMPHNDNNQKVTEIEMLKSKTYAPMIKMIEEISDPFVKVKTAFESTEDEKWNNVVFRKYGVESTMTETLSKKSSRQNIDLRDESIFHLVLGLFYTNGFSLATEKNRFQSSFKKQTPRVTEKTEYASFSNTTTTLNTTISKTSSKPQSFDHTSLFSQHFKDKGSLSQVLELYLLEFLEKNKGTLRSNLIFILMSELVAILNTISLYFYSTISQESSVNIPSFSYRGPELSCNIFETFMSCFPFVQLSTNKYTLEHWLSLSHINEIIYTLSRILKSRFWNFDFRPNCDLSHLKLDANLHVFDAHLPQPSSNSNILEIPLNELMYLQKNMKQEQDSSTQQTPIETLETRLKNSILFERNCNGVEKNLFAKYQPSLVQTCLDEVLNEIFSDKCIINTIRQRVAEKIDQL